MESHRTKDLQDERERPSLLVILSQNSQEGYYALILTPRHRSRESSSMNREKILKFMKENLPSQIEIAELWRYFPEQPKNSFFKYVNETVKLLRKKGLQHLILENGLVYE